MGAEVSPHLYTALWAAPMMSSPCIACTQLRRTLNATFLTPPPTTPVIAPTQYTRERKRSWSVTSVLCLSAFATGFVEWVKAVFKRGGR